MDKTVLSLILAVFFALPAHAEQVFAPTILPADGSVAIWSISSTTQTRLPSFEIVNTTDHCTLSANKIGKAEWRSIHIFFDTHRALKAAQVTSAVFDGCRIYFGRIKSLGPIDNEAKESAPMLLGEIKSVSAARMEISYKSSELKEELRDLDGQLLADPSHLSPDNSLVLMSQPNP